MIVAVLAALALIVALGALAVALLAYRRADDAQARAHSHLPRVTPPPVDDRQVNLGPPRLTGERRAANLGPAARHRAEGDERARRADRDDPAWGTRDELPATAEHAPPTVELRRLPPPGEIGPRR